MHLLWPGKEFVGFFSFTPCGGEKPGINPSAKEEGVMKSKVVVGLLMVLVALFFISSVATAQGVKCLCVSKKEMKGEDTVLRAWPKVSGSP